MTNAKVQRVDQNFHWRDDLPWWKTATGYQIYPRSFCDSNGDGIGDIPGIISKLDYLADLGIGFIWLSPVYRSPMVDNGYDISDYQDIAPEFGTLADMDNLISQAKARGIGIVMDLVVNHCSSEHPWFLRALKDPTCPEHDYFIWRKPHPQSNGAPDDSLSHFGGPAWTWVPELGKYYFHQFAAEQPDLNWDNAELRAEIYRMMNWWLDRGVAGFRMDVIDLIGKDVDSQQLSAGPTLHQHLQEMHRETLAGRNVVTVGEAWSVTPDTGHLYCGEDRKELSMVFQFAHIKAGWHPTLGKWHPLDFNLPRFKKSLFDWQKALANDGWNSLFLSNHDLPRQLSKYGHTGIYRARSAKLLATILHLLKGTPYIYQGEEIGMTNAKFTSLDQFRDIETFGHYEQMIAAGQTPEEFLAGANRNGRDNARTPVQWTGEENAGFTTGTPWIPVNDNYIQINAQADLQSDDSIFAHYQKLIALRNKEPIITLGDFTAFSEADENIFAYTRQYQNQKLSVIANLSETSIAYEVPTMLMNEGRCIAYNVNERRAALGTITLKPYEAFGILSAR